VSRRECEGGEKNEGAPNTQSLSCVLTYISCYAIIDGMHALDVLGDPVRRRILEMLSAGELSAGEIGTEIQTEFGISQPAVSQHLRVLREQGFASARAAGTRRIYAVAPEGVREASEWLTPFERFWRGPLAALDTELARGRRERARVASDPERNASGRGEE